MTTIGQSVKIRGSDGHIELATVRYSARPPYVLKVEIPSLGTLEAADTDLFRCLKRIRAMLEDSGRKVLVNGARIDASISGMAVDMSGGAQVYIHDRAGGRPRLAFIFDEAPEETVARVTEQESYHRALLEEFKWRATKSDRQRQP